MTSGELLGLFRDEMEDMVEPFLWSDALVYGYIDDAQKMFCRLTDGISDATTPAVTQLAVLPGVQWYATDPSVLKLRSTYRVDTGREVPVVNMEDMPAKRMFFDGTVAPFRALILGAEANKVRAYPIPDTSGEVQAQTSALALIGAGALEFAVAPPVYVGQAVRGAGIAPGTTVSSVTGAAVMLSQPTSAGIAAGATITFDLTLQMTVFRLPRVDITDDQELEVLPQHHRHLLLWAKHLAYSKQNAETFDRTRAKEFESGFLSYCSAAQIEQRRTRHKPRSVVYGGI